MVSVRRRLGTETAKPGWGKRFRRSGPSQADCRPRPAFFSIDGRNRTRRQELARYPVSAGVFARDGEKARGGGWKTPPRVDDTANRRDDGANGRPRTKVRSCGRSWSRHLPPNTRVAHPGSTQVVNIRDTIPARRTLQTPPGMRYFRRFFAGLTTRVTVDAAFTRSSSATSTCTRHVPGLAGWP